MPILTCPRKLLDKSFLLRRISRHQPVGQFHRQIRRESESSKSHVSISFHLTSQVTEIIRTLLTIAERSGTVQGRSGSHVVYHGFFRPPKFCPLQIHPHPQKISVALRTYSARISSPHIYQKVKWKAELNKIKFQCFN